MKNLFLTGALALTVSAAASAQAPAPKIIEGFYAQRFSSDGTWLASEAGGAALYNMATGELVPYTDCLLGLGNAVSNNGLGVGARTDLGVLMKNGRGSVLVPLRDYWMSSIDGITPDGRRITGMVANPDVTPGELDPDAVTSVPLIPFYCDLDEEGNAGELHLLPFPDKDFWGACPQNIKGLWISEDGKTILGQMCDNWGRLYDPIVYTEGENGEWSMTFPSRSLFNPEGIPLPPNPYVDIPEFPEARDYMDEETWEVYQQDLTDWYDYPDVYPEPDPIDYMSNEAAAEYTEKLLAYIDFFDNYEEAIKKFDEAFVAILETSTLFGINDLTMSADGKMIACEGSTFSLSGDGRSSIYIFDLTKDDFGIRKIDFAFPLVPTQILSDGTLIAVKPMTEIPSTYILFPGADEYVSFEDYIAPTNPDLVEWMNKTLAYGSGFVCFTDDMNTFAGGLTAQHYRNENDTNYFYSTYLGEKGEDSGVAEISGNGYILNIKGDGIISITGTIKDLEVFDLTGRSVFNITDASGDVSTGLSRGLYLVTAHDADGQLISKKIMF